MDTQTEKNDHMPSEGIVVLIGGVCGAGSAMLFEQALYVGLGTGVGVAVILLLYFGGRRVLQ